MSALICALGHLGLIAFALSLRIRLTATQRELAATRARIALFVKDEVERQRERTL